MARQSSFDDAMLRRMQTMWAEGARVADIAAELHRPVSTVTNLVIRLRAKGGQFPHRKAPKSADRDAAIKALWAEGKLQREIAEIVGCPVVTVANTCFRLNLPHRAKGVRGVDTNQVLAMWADGSSRREIADRFGIAVGTVSQMLARARQEGDRRERYYAPANARKAAAAAEAAL